MAEAPKLAITMGDPAGIGPEIIVKALSDARVYSWCRPLVVADAGVMRHAAAEVVKSPLAIREIASPAEAAGEYGVIDVLPPDGEALGVVVPGKVDARCGDAAFRSVRRAIELAMAGEVDGTVTAPLNKEALNLAGHRYDGHTELYAAFTGVRDYTMMLADGALRVAHVTTHTPMRNVPELITTERVLTVIRLADQACRRLGIAKPRVGVAGYNPHAGENGLFGDEEITRIRPAVRMAAAEGIDATGPWPPDTVFARAAGGGFDVVVAMYHDQGHIPLKALSFKYDGATGKWSGMTGVNVTLGLPIVRSSVDHGTAFENAGKNVSSAESMINAIEYGAMLSVDFKKDA